MITGSCATGKSTIVSLLQGLTQPDGGEVWIGGRNLAKLQADSMPYMRRNLGLMVQARPDAPCGDLVPYWTVAENIALPLSMLQLRQVECAYKLEAVLDKCGLADARDCRVEMLDAGTRARTALARATVADPDILICDEPTAGLDAVASLDLLERIADLHRGRALFHDDGTAKKLTLLVLTNQPEVIRFAHHASWRRERLVDGQLLDQLPGPRPTSPPLDDETQPFTTEHALQYPFAMDESLPGREA